MNNAVNSFLLFQTGWWGCVLLAAGFYNWQPLILTIFLISIYFLYFLKAEQRKTNFIFVGLSAIAGFTIDSTLSYLQIFTFLSPHQDIILAPIWLICLWALFALNFSISLRKLFNHYFICCLLGFIFGPISYWAGEAFGVLTFNEHKLMHLGIVGIVWAIIFPTFIWLYQRMEQHNEN